MLEAATLLLITWWRNSKVFSFSLTPFGRLSFQDLACDWISTKSNPSLRKILIRDSSIILLGMLPSSFFLRWL